MDRFRHYGARRFTALLGTASFLTLANMAGAQAQMAQLAQAQAANQAELPEQVLITGSLIRGAAAVGAPVTELGPQDFATTGSVTISDLLRDSPVITGDYVPSFAAGGFSYPITNINIHGIGGMSRTLVLIDGMRLAEQGTSSVQYDPSIIPQLAVDRVDILADGASATYGSEAIGGVVNVILKRGYDGAILQSSVGIANGGDFNYAATALYGRKWDGGDVTVSVSFNAAQAMKPTGNPYYTENFTPWGLNNDTPVRSAIVPILSLGPPNVQNGTACTNCYSVPKGQNGVGLTWAQLQANAGTGNQVAPSTDQWIFPQLQYAEETLTFDQNIFPNVQFNAEGYYANRRTQLRYPDSTAGTVVIPTTNPYYPAGAPAGLIANLAFPEVPYIEDTGEISDRYTLGLTINLPADWESKLYGATATETVVRVYPNPQPAIVTNNVNAALGATIPATIAQGLSPGLPSFTKPSSVPYLNVFCDPTAFDCIPPATLNYINDRVTNDSLFVLQQFGVNFDGPVINLPGGTVRAAIGGEYYSENYFINTITDPVTTQVQVSTRDALSRTIAAGFAQVDIPIFGNAFSFPGVEKLVLQISDRYDSYNDFGATNNPKYAGDWTVVDGFVLRGSWGTNFNPPTYKELSGVLGKQIYAVNGPPGTPTASGASSAPVPACPLVGGTPVAGSVAAVLNPTCSAANQFPEGISSSQGVGGLAGVIRPAGFTLQPETAKNWAWGFDLAPTDGWLGFLTGLDLNATLWSIEVSNTIGGVSNDLNNPNTTFSYILKGQPGFATALAYFYNNPLAVLSTVPQSNIQFIQDGSARNLGYEHEKGIDFGASYDWDLGAFGAWNTGVTGTYKMHDVTLNAPGGQPTDTFHFLSTLPVVGDYQTRASRMQYRARLGWSDDAGFSITGFVNYQSHYFGTAVLPPASYLAPFPNYSDLIPAQYRIDLSLGYNTGDNPANDYLKRINLTLSITNLMGTNPPFVYGGTGVAYAYASTIITPYGRSFLLTVSKTF